VQCLTEAHRKALATLPLAAMNVQRLYDELEPILPELVSKESASEKAQRYRKEAGHWNGLAAIYRSDDLERSREFLNQAHYAKGQAKFFERLSRRKPFHQRCLLLWAWVGAGGALKYSMSEGDVIDFLVLALKLFLGEEISASRAKATVCAFGKLFIRRKETFGGLGGLAPVQTIVVKKKQL
jgi:hypothetical protein